MGRRAQVQQCGVGVAPQSSLRQRPRATFLFDKINTALRFDRDDAMSRVAGSPAEALQHERRLPCSLWLVVRRRQAVQ